MGQARVIEKIKKFDLPSGANLIDTQGLVCDIRIDKDVYIGCVKKPSAADKISLPANETFTFCGKLYIYTGGGEVGHVSLIYYRFV